MNDSCRMSVRDFVSQRGTVNDAARGNDNDILDNLGGNEMNGMMGEDEPRMSVMSGVMSQASFYSRRGTFVD